MAIAGRDHCDRVTVMCPETDAPWQVYVSLDKENGHRVIGCSRFWGNLLCDASCEDEAVATAEKKAREHAPVYCGHPNLAAPRPREDS